MDENNKNVDIIKYQGMIGLLLYLTASWPDIILCFVYFYVHVFKHALKNCMLVL
jgi:hypothetical protein